MTALAAVAPLGHNNPPEPTPLEAHTSNIEDLYAEAGMWLDGAAIENQGQADEVTRLYDMLDKAAKAADKQRAAEKKPHDDAAKAVQAVWKPLVDKADRAAKAAKTVLGKWMVAEQQRLHREAEEARKAAEAEAERARAEHLAAAQTGDLNAIEAAEQSIADAKAAERAATRADKAKPLAKAEGMSRALGLRTVWSAALSDEPNAAQQLAKHYWQTRNAEVVEFYLSLARRDVTAGARAIPGIAITSEQVAR